MKQTTKRIWHIVGITWAAIVAQVFLLLCLIFFVDRLPKGWFIFSVTLASLINVALLAAELLFFFRRKQTAYKAIILTYFLVILGLVVFYVMLETGFMEIVRDGEKLKAYLERAGVWMSILFITLQFLQVVILPIPSTVTVVAGAALFGPFMGSVYSLIGIVAGSLVAFYVGRYAGYRVVAWIVGKETLDKWLKKIKGKDKLLLSAMFLLPVFPDDVLCFVAGLSSMSQWQFIAVIFVSRVLAIFTTSYSVSLIPFNTWWGILIWAILFVAVGVLFVFLYKKSDAIQDWILKKFHRETRVESKAEKDEFQLEVVNPDGSVVSKGVKKKGEKAFFQDKNDR